MSAPELAELYRPPRRIEKPGHNRKIGKAKYTAMMRAKKTEKKTGNVVEQPHRDTWAWNNTSTHDTILDGMEYCEAFNKIISTLAAPDPTDGHDYQGIYNTTKDENFPARNLLVAVLFSSWCDLHGFGVRDKAKRATAIREIAWMKCLDESYIYSFGFICDMLDIDRDAVYKAMLRSTEARINIQHY